ncbi:MAG: single-stranded DNA-binding protein [Bdellovibrionales bacterium]|nr:single-stranded DNA-binding protein [Bdellovibrionales bacterium]
MSGISKLFIAGNIGRSPVLQKSKNGKSYTFLSIATHRRSFNKESKTWDEFTDWHSVIVWGTVAENCVRFLEKGSPIAVEAWLEVTAEGKTLIRAEEVQFLGVRTREKRMEAASELTQ